MPSQDVRNLLAFAGKHLYMYRPPDPEGQYSQRRRHGTWFDRSCFAELCERYQTEGYLSFLEKAMSLRDIISAIPGEEQKQHHEELPLSPTPQVLSDPAVAEHLVFRDRRTLSTARRSTP